MQVLAASPTNGIADCVDYPSPVFALPSDIRFGVGRRLRREVCARTYLDPLLIESVLHLRVEKHAVFIVRLRQLPFTLRPKFLRPSGNLVTGVHHVPRARLLNQPSCGGVVQRVHHRPVPHT